MAGSARRSVRRLMASRDAVEVLAWRDGEAVRRWAGAGAMVRNGE